MRAQLLLSSCLLCAPGCIELDFFLFEPTAATSIEDDYHGLPLFVGASPPAWVGEVAVEREVSVSVSDDEYLHGVFLPAPTACPVADCPLIEDPPTILYHHGNSGNIWTYWYRVIPLWSLGANVFIYDYRGYGLSPGEASKARILTDAETAATYLLSRPEVNPQRLVAYGYSMGGVPASYVVGRSAVKDSFAALILESALDSPANVVRLSTGTDFPDGFFLDQDVAFDGPEYLRDTSLPVLHLHGRRDPRVISEQAKSYYRVLSSRPGYTHYIGQSSEPPETWIARCAHRNIPFWAFDAGAHLAAYWQHPDNPEHCCVHPDEYLNPANEHFFATIGHSSGAAVAASSQEYRRLITDWLRAALP